MRAFFMCTASLGSAQGLFIISPEGVVQHALVNDLPVGRSVGETLRLLRELRAASGQHQAQRGVEEQQALEEALGPVEMDGVEVEGGPNEATAAVVVQVVGEGRAGAAAATRKRPRDEQAVGALEQQEERGQQPRQSDLEGPAECTC